MTGLPMTPDQALDLAINLITKNSGLINSLAYAVLREDIDKLPLAERMDAVSDTLQRAVLELIKLKTHV